MRYLTKYSITKQAPFAQPYSRDSELFERARRLAAKRRIIIYRSSERKRERERAW